MTFQYPYLLAIPILYCLLLRRRRQVAAAPYPSIALLSNAHESWRARLRAPTLLGAELIAVVLFSIAAARPQNITNLGSLGQARNLMLALDVSGSMRAEDFPTSRGVVSRFDAVVSVVADFVKRRHADRLGLVVFGTQAYLQAPLTRDQPVILKLISEMVVGMAGEGTALGDGLGLALKRLQESPEGTRAVILLTDGVNNSGSVSPMTAARVASKLGVKVHTIGIGHPNGEGSYDEKMLREIAVETRGTFFNADNLEQLESVYEEIDRLELSEDEEDVVRIEELFPPYFAFASLFLGIAVLLNLFPFMRVP